VGSSKELPHSPREAFAPLAKTELSSGCEPVIGLRGKMRQYVLPKYGHMRSKDATGAGHLFDIHQSESCQNGIQFIKFLVHLSDPIRGHCQAGSLTGAVYLPKSNAGVLRAVN